MAKHPMATSGNKMDANEMLIFSEKKERKKKKPDFTAMLIDLWGYT